MQFSLLRLFIVVTIVAVWLGGTVCIAPVVQGFGQTTITGIPLMPYSVACVFATLIVVGVPAVAFVVVGGICFLAAEIEKLIRGAKD